MDVYYNIKKMLCKELEEVAKRGELSTGDLEVVDKLTHSIKSIVTIMAMEDSGYSYNDGYSGARRRDSMGRYYDDYDRRYSRDEGKSHMIHQFETLMNDASTQEERDIIHSAINKLKNM